jgi:polar amino acid transport system substrate-binding protein
MKKTTWGAALATLAWFTVAVPAEAADTLQRIRQQGMLKWGADAEGGAPYVYPDPKNPGQLIGFEVDLAAALAAKLGVRAEMAQNQWENLVPALQRGDFDIILNGLEITDEHRREIGMSRPYYAYAQQIVTRQDTAGLTNLAALRGKTVGTLSGSTSLRLVEEMGGATVRPYPGQVEPFRDLANQRIDAVLFDLPIVAYYLRNEPTLRRAGPPFAIGYYGRCWPRSTRPCANCTPMEASSGFTRATSFGTTTRPGSATIKRRQ